MTFYRAAKPFVQEKLFAYANGAVTGEDNSAFKHLEDAHVIGQQSTRLHILTHYHMLKHGLKHNDVKESFAQIIRLAGALTKTWIGLIPRGNTGSANVNPFKSLPISKDNEIVLDEIRRRQSGL